MADVADVRVVGIPAQAPAGGRSGGPAARRRQRESLGALPLLAAIAAAGLVVVALANNAAREGEAGGQLLFWLGLATIYAPLVFRLLSRSASRTERMCLVVLMGVALFFVKVLYSPLRYPPFDELATWRQTYDLLSTGRPFSSNPIAAGFPGFPGLETVTAALAQLGGLSIFHAGLVVIGVARATLMLALFLFLERVTGSDRAAGIGVAVYACNPSFLYFDSQFGHESLALALGAALLLAVTEWGQPSRIAARTTAGPAVAVAVLGGALTITHHMSSYALTAFLLIWAGFARHLRTGRVPPDSLAGKERAGAADAGSETPSAHWRAPVYPAVLMLALTATWFVFVGGGDTIAELGSVLSGAVDSIVRLISGSSGPKTLFQGSSQNNPTLARFFAFESVVPLLALIPFGLWKIWRMPRPDALWRALAIAALLYPVTLGLRLTLSGTETSQRASEFVFVGLAFFAAILFKDLRFPRGALRRLGAYAGISILATTMFCGAFIVAELPTTRQPGPFLVGADARSVSPEGLAAARFAAQHLPHDSRVLADRANGTLLGSYGLLDPVLGQIDGVPVARILFSSRLDRVDRRAIVDDEIEYIVVDQRLDRELPNLGFYIEPEEPLAFARARPLEQAALDKFHTADGLNRIYTNGPIAIYSTDGLTAP